MVSEQRPRLLHTQSDYDEQQPSNEARVGSPSSKHEPSVRRKTIAKIGLGLNKKRCEKDASERVVFWGLFFVFLLAVCFVVSAFC